MRTTPQCVVLFHHFGRFLEACAVRGIDVAPIKGAHLLTSVYTDESARGRMADVDFLVRDRDWAAVLDIAEGIGWVRRDSPFDESRTHEVGFLWRFERGELLFEAHRALFDPRRFAIDHEGIWERAEKGSFDGVPCLRLRPEDHFAHIALHETVHRLSSLGRTLRDLELLAESEGFSAEALFDRAREWNVRRAVWLMLELLAPSRPELEAVGRRNEIAPRADVRRASLALAKWSASESFGGVNHRLKAALLWPWLFDSKRALARLCLNHPRAVDAFRRLRNRSGT